MPKINSIEEENLNDEPDYEPKVQMRKAPPQMLPYLKPDRIVTREKNGDSIDSMSFLNHKSTKDVDPSKPLPKTSDDKHVLEVYYIDNIANLPAHLKDMREKQKKDRLNKLKERMVAMGMQLENDSDEDIDTEARDLMELEQERKMEQKALDDLHSDNDVYFDALEWPEELKPDSVQAKTNAVDALNKRRDDKSSMHSKMMRL